MNTEPPDIHTQFRKGRGTGDQSANIHVSWRKQGNSRKASTFVSLIMLEPLTVWITINLEISKRDGSNCLLRNLYASQEAAVRARCGTTNGIKIGTQAKGCC